MNKSDIFSVHFADGIKALGVRPAKRLREAATGIFLWPAWGLYDTIKEDQFKHINSSHD